MGLGSCIQWLNWRCGMSPGVAREKIRVARALPDLPRISKLFSAGQISYSKVRAMTRVATQKNEDALLMVALHGTARHVETQVRLYRRVKRIEALKKENERHDHRELSWRIDEDGYWIFQGRFTPEQGAVILVNDSADAGSNVSADAVRIGGGLGIIDRGGTILRTFRYPEFTPDAWIEAELGEDQHAPALRIRVQGAHRLVPVGNREHVGAV